MTINLADVIGPLCMLGEQGDTLRERIVPELRACRPVELDFTGVKTFMPAFLMRAIGSLYGLFSKDFLATHLKVTGLKGDDSEYVQAIRERAVWYFEQPEGLRELLHAINPVEAFEGR
ncbi:MAG: STAS-like domain-containing protein [Gemmataceae bacterium]